MPKSRVADRKAAGDASKGLRKKATRKTTKSGTSLAQRTVLASKKTGSVSRTAVRKAIRRHK